MIGKLRNDLTHHFLQEEAPHAGTGIHSRENKDRFKHDGEVIPVGHQIFHPGDTAEDIGHTDGKTHGAARTGREVFLHFSFKHRQVLHGHAEFGKLVRG